MSGQSFRDVVKWGMTNDTSRLMTKIRRKMTRWEGLILTHCGHESEVLRALDARFELEGLIESGLEERDQKINDYWSAK